MPSVNELINQRITRLRSVPTNLITAIDKVNIQLFDELIRLLGNLETSGGNLVLNSDNLARVEEIAQILQAVMFDGDYIKAVVQFAKEYGVQLDLNKQILSALGDFTDDALFGQIMTAAQTQSIALLDESAVTAQFSQVIKDILTQSISTEQRFSDAVDQLRDFIIGNPDLEPAKDGAWTKHAKQIAFDAFAISDRRTHNIMADQSGYEWFRYDGQEIKGVIRENQQTGERREVGGSRCFCRARKGKIFHISELEAWGNRENINEPGNCEITLKDGSLGWQGINDATNARNIREFLGGWNCVDILVAVPLSDVPAADLARVEGGAVVEPSKPDTIETGQIKKAEVIDLTDKFFFYHFSPTNLEGKRLKFSSMVQVISGDTIKGNGFYVSFSPTLYKDKGRFRHNIAVNITNPLITTDQFYSALITDERKEDLLSTYDSVVLIDPGKLEKWRKEGKATNLKNIPIREIVLFSADQLEIDAVEIIE